MIVKEVPVRAKVDPVWGDSEVCEKRTLNLPKVPVMLAEVVKQIKAKPELFNMGDWHTKAECRTQHCVAGWVSALYNPEYAKNMRAKTFQDPAEDFAHRVLNPKDDEDREWELSGIFYDCDATSEQIVTALEAYSKNFA